MPDFDVAIVGGGPGGYVAAIRAAQLGLRAALVERDALGGVCLNRGCIPGKVLLHAASTLRAAREGAAYGIEYEGLRIDLGTAVDRSREVVEGLRGGIELLLQQHGVEVVRGTARLRDAGTLDVTPGDRVLTASNVVIATGARPLALPGVEVDGKRVLTSTEALALRDVPQSIAVIGGGAVGVEFAYLFRAFGAEVTLIEALPRLLPDEDEETSEALQRAFREQGIDVRTGVAVRAVRAEGGGAAVTLADPGDGGNGGGELRAECVLVAAGIAPNSGELGLEALDVAMERGFVTIDERCRTNVAGLWAIGDVTGRLPLAHVASAQGIAVAEAIAGLDPPSLEYEWMPRAVYCEPQVASAGLTERQARERGLPVRVGRHPLAANARAATLGVAAGLVKMVAHAETGEVLGVHIVGPEAAELIGEATLGRALETTAAEMARAVRPHPTLTEAIREAALDVTGEALHFFSPRRER